MTSSGQYERNHWLQICTNIAVALERDRRTWFENCLKMVAEVKRKIGLPFETANSTIGGRADLALRAYQLITPTRLMSVRKYVPPADGQDFADLLWAQVCRTNLDDVFELVARYREKREEEAERFGRDVACFITGESSPSAFALSLEIMMPTPQLTVHTAMIVAACFGDKDTVQDMKAQLNR